MAWRVVAGLLRNGCDGAERLDDVDSGWGVASVSSADQMASSRFGLRKTWALAGPPASAADEAAGEIKSRRSSLARAPW